MPVAGLGTKCLSEGVATGLMIFLGEGVLANELLSSTKGQGFGFGWVSAGFGFAFYVSLVCFNGVSARMNPAALLAEVVMRKLWIVDAIALCAAELAGAMAGATLMWLFYLPHFKSLPEPPPRTPADRLLRSRNALDPSALNISSYDTRPHANANKGFVDAYKDVRYYLFKPGVLHEPYHVALQSHVMDQHDLFDPEGFLRRRSVQVSDLHHRMMQLEAGRSRSNSHHRHCNTGALDAAAENRSTEELPPADEETARLRALYAAACRADKNAKLSVFATRPAIRSPIFNWVVEFLCTTTLILGANLIAARGLHAPPQLLFLWGPIEALLDGFLIFVLILGLGGPTGIAMNPARDLGPRIMHWALPIAGKGPSEWEYAWIPVTAGFVGGASGGALVMALDQALQHIEGGPVLF